MRIGVISDPHGCLVGLKATLDWLEGAGVDVIGCAGDVANFGPKPNECIALLAEREIPTVQGNSDRAVVEPAQALQRGSVRAAEIAAINAWCRRRLTQASRQWLAALPSRLVLAPGVLMVHGGLDALDQVVTADAQPDLPPGISVVAAGHLHVPFIARTGKGMCVNAGSAGRPCDGDSRTALVVLEQRPGGWEASIHRVPFDLEAAVREICRVGMPYATRLAETQRKACWW
jgi:predicted phosphodiesterase